MKRIAHNEAGAAALEFALVAPLLLLFLFGILETSRAVWARQVMQRATHSTVRCVSIGMTECTTEAGIRSYFLAQARTSSIPAASITVTSAKDVPCEGMERQNSVTITAPYTTPVAAFLPKLAGEISSTACFPDVSRLSKG
jgi:Flp pilus assembly protein TadG